MLNEKKPITTFSLFWVNNFPFTSWKKETKNPESTQQNQICKLVLFNMTSEKDLLYVLILFFSNKHLPMSSSY